MQLMSVCRGCLAPAQLVLNQSNVFLKLPAHNKQSELHLLKVWTVKREQRHRSLYNVCCVHKTFKLKR